MLDSIRVSTIWIQIRIDGHSVGYRQMTKVTASKERDDSHDLSSSIFSLCDSEMSSAAVMVGRLYSKYSMRT